MRSDDNRIIIRCWVCSEFDGSMHFTKNIEHFRIKIIWILMVATIDRTLVFLDLLWHKHLQSWRWSLVEYVWLWFSSFTSALHSVYRDARCVRFRINTVNQSLMPFTTTSLGKAIQMPMSRARLFPVKSATSTIDRWRRIRQSMLSTRIFMLVSTKFSCQFQIPLHPDLMSPPLSVTL